MFLGCVPHTTRGFCTPRISIPVVERNPAFLPLLENQNTLYQGNLVHLFSFPHGKSVAPKNGRVDYMENRDNFSPLSRNPLSHTTYPQDLSVQRKVSMLCGFMFPRERGILHSCPSHRKSKSSISRKISSFSPFHKENVSHQTT